ncbi:MAG: sulfotransferase [Candidatus Electrothrix sp. AU1_5]|nr:sulfotransferase [Candidatus Electrothrix gigas]
MPEQLTSDGEIVFLTYLNRSGSTYLSAKLSKYQEVRMGVEARFIDGWITPGFSICTEEELHSYLDTLYLDNKFQAWKIERDELVNRVSALSYPLRFSDILLAALSLYQGRVSAPRLLVHKCGEYYRCVQAIRQELPGAKFIFVNRDPRAVFSSQRRSLDSQTGQPMQKNILHFLFGYLDTLQRLKELDNDPNFLVVQYEELIANEAEAMCAIEKFLKLSSSDQETGKSDYFSSIPPKQRYLHQHVQSGAPCSARVTGWQQELPTAYILLLQTVLKNYLRKKNFSFYTPPKITLSDLGQFMMLLCLYRYEWAKRKLFGIQHRY